MNHLFAARFWRDSSGRIVIWQMPNAWLWGWLVAAILSRLIEVDRVATIIGDVGSAFLLVWAVLELSSGASRFRRLLGAVVLVGLVVLHFHY